MTDNVCCLVKIIQKDERIFAAVQFELKLFDFFYRSKRLTDYIYTDIYCKLSKCIGQTPCSYKHYLVFHRNFKPKHKQWTRTSPTSIDQIACEWNRSILVTVVWCPDICHSMTQSPCNQIPADLHPTVLRSTIFAPLIIFTGQTYNSG